MQESAESLQVVMPPTLEEDLKTGQASAKCDESAFDNYIDLKDSDSVIEDEKLRLKSDMNELTSDVNEVKETTPRYVPCHRKAFSLPRTLEVRVI